MKGRGIPSASPGERPDKDPTWLTHLRLPALWTVRQYVSVV